MPEPGHLLGRSGAPAQRRGRRGHRRGRGLLVAGLVATSEHQDGRAVDWAADVSSATDRARVGALLDDLFATDRAGNADALARRLGVMYVIWNDHIYAAYDGFSPRDYLNGGCRTRATCSKTLRHRDHVHLSLSRAGAAGQTSFYRRHGVARVPVLYPGTRRLDPVSTAVAEITVPSDGSVVHSGFRLTRGTTYRIVADGRYRFGAGSRVSDAVCSWSRRKDGWVPSSHGLLVNGTSPWSEVCDGPAAGAATHQATYTPHRTRRLTLRLADTTPGNNRGTLHFSVLRDDLPVRTVRVTPPVAAAPPHPARRAGARARARQLHQESVELHAARAHGVRTRHALHRGAHYRVVVRGVARSGGTRFDGNCARYAGRMRPHYSLDLAHPADDQLTVAVQGVTVPLRVHGSSRACSAGHTYVGDYRAIVRGRARVSLFDPYSYADNSGILTVTLTRRG